MFIGSELFRQGPRPKAMAVVGIALWVASFVIAIGFEPLQVSLVPIFLITFTEKLLICVISISSSSSF